MRKYLCIVDFEATCFADNNPGRRQEMEIIEFGCCMSEADTLKNISEFQSFVKPVRNPELTDFCKTLTSIRQLDVDKAPAFPLVLGKFSGWLVKTAGDLDQITFASWGKYDFNQLNQDCNFHELLFPFTGEHLNLKEYVATKMGWSPKGVQKALGRLGLEFDGTPHRGIDDARNILRIIQKVGLYGLDGIIIKKPDDKPGRGVP